VASWVAVRELVGIESGVVSGVINLESPGVGAPGRRPRHDEPYHEAYFVRSLRRRHRRGFSTTGLIRSKWDARAGARIHRDDGGS
jgi:hypothetical protein